MTACESLLIGIVLERRKIDHPWKDYSWRAVDVVQGADPSVSWQVLREEEGRTLFLARTLELELHPKLTEGYKEALGSARPSIFVVLRPGEEEDDEEVEPFLVTACPYEAQDYLDSGEEMVEAIPMTAELNAWISDFVGRYHVEQKFKKRKLRKQESDIIRRRPVIGGDHG